VGKSTVILPKKLSVDPQRMRRAITNTLASVAQNIKTDFEVTQQTWADKATFVISSPTPWTREVATDDENYTRLNEGTRPHIIRPRAGGVLVFRTPFRSKTVPRSIASGPGRTGNTPVFTRGPINHPGTTARQFDQVIAEKWEKQFATIMQRAIDAEVS
jgi:hypothetical protein